LNNKNATDIGKKLVKLYKNKKYAFQLLYVVSNAKKIRAIFDITIYQNGIFVIYIKCRLLTNIKSIIFELTFDYNFAKLISSIKGEFVRMTIKNIKPAKEEAKCLIIRKFAMQILYLIILNKKFENFIPYDYLLI